MDFKNHQFGSQDNIFKNNNDINNNNIVNNVLFKNIGNINNNINNISLRRDLNNEQININDKSNDLKTKAFIDYYNNLTSNNNSNILFPQINQFSNLTQSSHNFFTEPINNILNNKLNFINSSKDLLIKAINKNLIKNEFKKGDLK